MRNINFLFGWMILLSVHVHAITIEEMAEKNNKILELDQDIAIAEKLKKLAQLKGESMQPETVQLPKTPPTRREEYLSVLSVHGSPADPIVDVQYGDRLLQKRRGEALPDGWQITAIGHSTVTFQKKDAVKTVSIGALATADGGQVPAPSH